MLPLPSAWGEQGKEVGSRIVSSGFGRIFMTEHERDFSGLLSLSRFGAELLTRPIQQTSSRRRS
jgi:hypothetical protein